MAFVEAEAAKNVIEACGSAAYVKRCIFTSSLLACIWKNDLPNLIDESSWSDEAFCRENKVYLLTFILHFRLKGKGNTNRIKMYTYHLLALSTLDS